MTDKIIARFFEACVSGDKVSRRMSLRPLGIIMRDPASLRRIANLDQVHPQAQAKFLSNWTRVAVWQRIRAETADDELWFAVLRKLLPTYAGSPIMLYRGQSQSEPLGMSWTRNDEIAENFAKYRTAVPTEIKRLSADPPLPGLVYYAKLSTEIICAPCLLGHKEGEYIVDPRNIEADFYDPGPFPNDPRIVKMVEINRAFAAAVANLPKVI